MTAKRICTKCGKARPDTAFVSARARICYLCREQGRKAQVRKLHLDRTYGMTVEQYEALSAQQGGRCAGCLGTRRYNLHVDHDHRTGLVRGLLCASCNKVLGMVRDDPNRLYRLTNYLLSPPAKWAGVTVVAPAVTPGKTRQRRKGWAK